MRRVLFVCMGNICRSPAAEGVFRRLVAERGLTGEIEIDSAGTIGYHAGSPPDRRMRQAATARGFQLDDLRARQVESADLHRFDLVVAMDRENLSDLQHLGGGHPARAEVRLFSDFVPGGQPVDVPDPYYGGAEGFEQVLDLLEAGAPAVLERLLELPG